MLMARPMSTVKDVWYKPRSPRTLKSSRLEDSRYKNQETSGIWSHSRRAIWRVRLNEEPQAPVTKRLAIMNAPPTLATAALHKKLLWTIMRINGVRANRPGGRSTLPVTTGGVHAPLQKTHLSMTRSGFANWRAPAFAGVFGWSHH